MNLVKYDKQKWQLKQWCQLKAELSVNFIPLQGGGRLKTEKNNGKLIEAGEQMIKDTNTLAYVRGK